LPQGIFIKERLPVLQAGLIQAWDHLTQEISTMARRLSQAMMVIGLMLAVVAPARADEHWIKLPTVPYTLNNKQDAIAFADALTGWYGNGTGRIYRTDDGGEAWTAIWTKQGTYVRALEFADAQTGFLGNIGPGYFPGVTDRQPLYVSHDGGVHWTAVRPVAGRQIVGVCAIDVLKAGGKVVAVRAGGRVGGPAGMLESFDEGRTFRARDMSSVTGMILDIHFVDENTGFIAGASAAEEDKAHARILKTTDGGKSWRAVFDSDRAGDNNWKLAFPSARIGYATIISYRAPAGEARGYVVKTEDGGEHWRRLAVTHDANWIPYGIAFIDEERGWVGGSTGGYATRDGGKTWAPQDMGLSTNKIAFVPRADGGVSAFAIGKDIYKLELPANGR
jgi:photosystem II stability/assembly factor-like uncharacterized protein